MLIVYIILAVVSFIVLMTVIAEVFLAIVGVVLFLGLAFFAVVATMYLYDTLKGSKKRGEVVDSIQSAIDNLNKGPYIGPGRIMEIRPTEVMVDIGDESEVAIPAVEFPNFDALNVGDEIEVCINERGKPISNIQGKPMNHELTTQNDLIENPSPRCACTVILDTSASMGGRPIEQLNQGMQQFMQAVHSDEVTACTLEISVITAGGIVQEHLPFTSALSVEGCQPFSAGGMTPLGGAVDLALRNLERRKAEFKKAGVPYYQPWLVIISDGGPNDDNWQVAAARARQLSADNKLVSLVVGVEGADMTELGLFSHRPPVKLDGLKFGEFFQWLSASMSRVSQSASTTAKVTLPSMDGWASI